MRARLPPSRRKLVRLAPRRRASSRGGSWRHEPLPWTGRSQRFSARPRRLDMGTRRVVQRRQAWRRVRWHAADAPHAPPRPFDGASRRQGRLPAEARRGRAQRVAARGAGRGPHADGHSQCSAFVRSMGTSSRSSLSKMQVAGSGAGVPRPIAASNPTLQP